MPNLDVTEFGRWFYGPSWTYVLKPKRVLEPTGALRENFTGYALPPNDTKTVGEIEAFYVHGQPSEAAPNSPVTDEIKERGYPISGDWTRRRQFAENVTYGEIPDRAPLGALF